MPRSNNIRPGTRGSNWQSGRHRTDGKPGEIVVSEPSFLVFAGLAANLLLHQLGASGLTFALYR